MAAYHNGSSWSQSGFSPANPLANTATNATSPNLSLGNYNFQVCCNKNYTNYGCSPQQPVAVNACPTPTPGVPGTPVAYVTPPVCTNSNSTWGWSPVANAVSYEVQRRTTGTGTNWNWVSIQTTTSFTSSFNSGMATGGYGIRVAGINGVNRHGNTSNWVDISRDISSPTTPVGLNLVCNTNGSVSASWSPAADVGCGGLHSYPYWARLSTDPNFGSSSLIYSSGTWPDGWTSGITKSTPANAFGPGVTVYGRVRSRDTFDQQSAWAVNDSCVIPTAIPSPTPGTSFESSVKKVV